ncbi:MULTISPECIES: hypothetical protein [unclassified Dehalobacter]|uniref:hypothetical protein n=1 Tax=unclassified Dehalobacter TaxID=2635733 RepID=UPI000E6C0A97|nr:MULTISPECIES: hypothetical protein [unclassified Dehalobacter]RJE48435.1 hypothetical protein A7K50_11185 [Dehalobacter sp. MCB1]TCX50503.1 hypothetical protein C1I36_08080 [Dehalobacter sp. 14DCB1]TCX52257.1 hypothetical protein C1I38_09650 [Dehalobacter sp. 12DCB1]
MKTTGHLVLYISENEDFELWRVLSQIPPEERSAFVKNALKTAIVQNNEARNSQDHGARQNNVLRLDKSAGQSPVMHEVAMEELGYSTIAAADEKVMRPLMDGIPQSRGNPRPEVDFDLVRMEELLRTGETRPKTSLPGLDFLLTNVIGEEDDEKVIEFVRKSQTASAEE